MKALNFSLHLNKCGIVLSAAVDVHLVSVDKNITEVNQ